MANMHFERTIHASPEKLWNALWDDASYRKWTSAFSPTSHAVTDDWKEGSKVLFLDGEGSGMVSTIAENRPNEYMSIKHLGEVKNGVEDTTSEKVQAWNGAMENYKLTRTPEGTHLAVELIGNIPDEFTDYFEKTWPVALDKLQALAEEN